MSRNYWTPEQEEKLLATVDMLRGAVPSTVRVECRGCKACRAYKIEFAHFDVGGESLGDFYIVSRREDGSVARRFTRREEAEEFVRLQVAGRGRSGAGMCDSYCCGDADSLDERGETW